MTIGISEAAADLALDLANRVVAVSHEDAVSATGLRASSYAVTVQVAWPFKRLGAESLDELIGRWAGWLAEASEQKLHRPTTMPEGSPQGIWRGSV